MDISLVGTAAWNDSAERCEWAFMSKMMREASDHITPHLSGLHVAIDIADARAKEGWRSKADKDDRPIDVWRELALQFDAQRMTAMGHLKAVVWGVDGAMGSAEEFISESPETGSGLLTNATAVPFDGESGLLGCPFCGQNLTKTDFDFHHEPDVDTCILSGWSFPLTTRHGLDQRTMWNRRVR